MSPRGLYTRSLNFPLALGLFIVATAVTILVLRQLASQGGYLEHRISSIPLFSPPASPITLGRPLQIVFTEFQAAHDEVVAPLIEAFASLPNVEISALFLSTPNRFGSSDMYADLKLPISIPEPLQTSQMFPWIWENSPDFIVAASCGYDDFDNYKLLLDSTETHIFCVVHHADQWKDWLMYMFERKVGAWVGAKRVDFVTLSQHVANNLPASLLAWKDIKWGANFPPIRVFPPVFTLDLPQMDTDGKDEIDFALQGNYQRARRNYTMAFEQMERMKNITETSNVGDRAVAASVKLHLVGSGDYKPRVPDVIKDMVVFDENLNYTEFYTVLHSMTAILPAFADDDYYVNKASSSIPASLIAGSPLVATRKMLNTYTYLDEQAVWLQGDKQSDFDMLMEILQKPREERSIKREKAKAAGAAVVEKNKLLVAEWVEVALRKREARVVEKGTGL